MATKKYVKVMDVGIGTDLPRVGDKIGGWEIVSIVPSDAKPHRIVIRYPKKIK